MSCVSSVCLRLSPQNSRWDLAFSDTKKALEVDVDQIEIVADNQAADGTTYHDDGNGRIPASWLPKIQHMIGEEFEADCCQIRIEPSIKGVLKADPDIDHIIVPESMVKWPLPQTGRYRLSQKAHPQWTHPPTHPRIHIQGEKR
eukprot:COSAG02_NODE_16957_length_1040_cov_1.650372_2_plen_143_part_01